MPGRQAMRPEADTLVGLLFLIPLFVLLPWAAGCWATRQSSAAPIDLDRITNALFCWAVGMAFAAVVCIGIGLIVLAIMVGRYITGA